MNKRIFFVSHADALGGAEIGLLRIFAELNRSKWEPHLICPQGALLDEAQTLGVPVYPLELPRIRRSFNAGSNWRKTGDQIAALVREGDGDAIYAATIRGMLYGIRAASAAPLIWHVHDFWLSESRPRFPAVDALLKRWMSGHASKIIVNSEATARMLPNPRTAEVLYFGVGEIPDDCDPLRFREKYGIPTDHLVVGMAGRMRPWKGQLRFLEAARLVADVVPRVKFLVVGGDVFNVGGDYPQRVKQAVEQNGLAGQVIFTGQLPSIFEALAAMDVFVHPGDPEPFGLVNIEAMAMKRPVVAFAHGALPEIVVDGQTGYLVPPDRPELLAAQIVALLQAEETRQTLGEAGHRRFAELFTPAKMSARFDEIMDSVFK